MKKTIVTLLMIGSLALAAGCNTAGNSETEVTTQPVSSEPETFNQNTKYADHILTKEEMLEDYDAIWKAFEENSPFFGVINRQYEVGYYDGIVEKYRQQIIEMEVEGDDAMLEFITIIAYSMSEAFDVDGHAGIYNPGRYFSDLEVYKELIGEMPDLQPWLDVMDKPEVYAFYEYYEYLIERLLENSEGADANQEQQLETEEVSEQENENLTMEILQDGKTAYIKVNSFDTSYMEEDLPQIHAFLESVKDYEHLIIDIADNGGGNASYWEEAFVLPNLTEPVTTSFVRMMRDGELAVQFYGSMYEDTELTVEDIRNNPAYTALQPEDLNQLAFAREYSYTTEPQFEEKLFQGKIWVLIDSQVYSSAESFAVFCKDTGFATLVGKPTGGGNTGGPVMFELPNSHLLVAFDVEYALNSDGSCSQEIGTMPDIESEDSLQTVLDLIVTVQDGGK